MAVELTMPKFGLTMHEGTLQRFFKAPGEAIKAGEPLYEVETEKVLYEVESPVVGHPRGMVSQEGAIVECGRPVAVIAEAGEDPAAIAAQFRRRLRRRRIPRRLRLRPSRAKPQPLSKRRPQPQAADVARSARSRASARRNWESISSASTAPDPVDGSRARMSNARRSTAARMRRRPSPRPPPTRRWQIQPHLARNRRCALCRCAGCAARSRRACIRACATPPSSRSPPKPT